jgi:hypothetical protein
MTRRQLLAHAAVILATSIGSTVIAAQAKTVTVTLIIDGMT